MNRNANSLAKLRQFVDGMDVVSYLKTEMRQNLMTLEKLLNVKASSTDGLSESQLATRVEAPIGSMMIWPWPVIPSNALVADGSLITVSKYPDLAKFARDPVTNKYAWGANSDSSQMNLPDMRGVVPRGVDGGKGLDPDAAARVAMNANGNTGSNVGTYQADQLISHDHFMQRSNTGGGAGVSIGDGSALGFSSTKTSLVGGSETRGKNAYVYYIIIVS